MRLNFLKLHGIIFGTNRARNIFFLLFWWFPNFLRLTNDNKTVCCDSLFSHTQQFPASAAPILYGRVNFAAHLPSGCSRGGQNKERIPWYAQVRKSSPKSEWSESPIKNYRNLMYNSLIGSRVERKKTRRRGNQKRHATVVERFGKKRHRLAVSKGLR